MTCPNELCGYFSLPRSCLFRTCLTHCPVILLCVCCAVYVFDRLAVFATRLKKKQNWIELNYHHDSKKKQTFNTQRNISNRSRLSKPAEALSSNTFNNSHYKDEVVKLFVFFWDVIAASLWGSYYKLRKMFKQTTVSLNVEQLEYAVCIIV